MFGEVRVVVLFGCAWYCVVLRGYKDDVRVREKRGERRRTRRLSVAGLPPPVGVDTSVAKPRMTSYTIDGTVTL